MSQSRSRELKAVIEEMMAMGSLDAYARPKRHILLYAENYQYARGYAASRGWRKGDWTYCPRLDMMAGRASTGTVMWSTSTARYMKESRRHPMFWWRAGGGEVQEVLPPAWEDAACRFEKELRKTVFGDGRVDPEWHAF